MEGEWLPVDAAEQGAAGEGSAVLFGGHFSGWVEVECGGCLLKAPFWLD